MTDCFRTLWTDCLLVVSRSDDVVLNEVAVVVLGVVLVVVCVVVAVDCVVDCVGVLSTSVRFSSSDTSIGEVEVLWKDFSTNAPMHCNVLYNLIARYLYKGLGLPGFPKDCFMFEILKLVKQSG